MSEASEMEISLPEIPVFDQKTLERCRLSGNFMPIAFEMYRYIAELCTIVAHIVPSSPCFREHSRQHYHVLMGLLTRCARLMLANLALSHEGKFGETTAIIDRSIFESAAKVLWLCFEPGQQKFNRFMAGGLKTELELKDELQEAIKARGNPLPIETRMLTSIDYHITSSGLTERQITETPGMPDLASLLIELGHERLLYVVGQRLGSHHVHGTWPSLLFHYLEQNKNDAEFDFSPRGHDCDTNANQFLFAAIFVIGAVQGYSKYFLDNETHEMFWKLLDEAETKVKDIYILVGEKDLRHDS